MTRAQIQGILDARGLRPLRQLGQNFLIDANLCRRIYDIIEAPANETIVEIGPGLGSLTEQLLQAHPVTCLEIDKGIVEFLADRFADQDNLKIVPGDALETMKSVEPFAWLVGNVPYNISTPLLATVLALPTLPKQIVFTVQRELAQRLTAQPRTKEYNAVSILLQTFYQISIDRTLPPSVFYPEPRVDSAIIALKRIESPGVPPSAAHDFQEMLKKAFSQRRKKLRKLLPVESEARAEELSIEQWHELFHALKN